MSDVNDKLRDIDKKLYGIPRMEEDLQNIDKNIDRALNGPSLSEQIDDALQTEIQKQSKSLLLGIQMKRRSLPYVANIGINTILLLWLLGSWFLFVWNPFVPTISFFICLALMATSPGRKNCRPL